jgi:hypothetical protein
MAITIKGDVGTVFQMALVNQDNQPLDLTGASVLEIIFLKPDGTFLTKTASLVGAPELGTISASFTQGDLDTEGQWGFQARVVNPLGAWKSRPGAFLVGRAYG